MSTPQSRSVHRRDGNARRGARSRRIMLLLLLVCIVHIAACEREGRESRSAPLPETGPAKVLLSSLHPGTQAPPQADPRGAAYERNAYHINQGERLFRWFNC